MTASKAFLSSIPKKYFLKELSDPRPNSFWRNFSMKSRTVQEAKAAMLASGDNWRIPFMEFVDDLRRTHDPRWIGKPFNASNDKFDSLLASTIEYLCDEMGIETPDWIWEVPACAEPWFISGYENLKAISIAESPAFFRRRKIFVLKNFLSRV
jgi:hypothetical protein